MVKLSVVIITYNEEKNIQRCLDSVKGIADEILVVDSYSQDTTVNICREYGARVIQNRFEGHIQQKNYAVSQSSNSNILSLDADESLSEELRQSIQEAKQSWPFSGYKMNRMTNYCGAWIRHGGWYPDTKIRLFERNKGTWTGINPHDRYEMNDPATTVGYLKGDILHHSYNSISDHIKQVDYFTDISARMLFETNKRATLGHIIISPLFRLCRDYVLKGGFLDGYYGFVICIISSHAVFLKYIKLRELWKTK
jgi:glycosyltransferase involved in cell wall biosynthesis